jgi:serine protease
MASPAEPNPIGPPKIALKLSPAGQKQQQADKDFIAKLIRKIEPNLGLIPVVGPLVPAGSLAAIAQKVALGVALDPKYQSTDFDAWYEVTFESQTSITAASNVDPTEYAIPSWVLKLVQDLHNVDEVESVHPMQAGPPPTVNAGDDPRNTNQGYLDAAPKGINARYAWGFPGGDGAGANVVDMEQGWNLNHEDLVGLFTQRLLDSVLILGLIVRSQYYFDIWRKQTVLLSWNRRSW